MSLVEKEIIECPHCHQEGEYDHWKTINADLNPELREKIFSEELFLYRCPHCGKFIHVPAGFLYHDMTHKFMISFNFFEEDNYDYEPVKVPEGFELQDQYKFRTTFGLYNLKEKIRILEKRLDDVAIEHLKYMFAHYIDPELAKKGHKLFFEKIEDPEDEEAHGNINFSFYDKDKETTIGFRLSMKKYYEHKLACELDPRMQIGEGIAMCVDEGWIDKQMKED